MKINHRSTFRLSIFRVITSALFILTSAHFSLAAFIDIMLVYDTNATTWVNSNGGMTAFSQDSVNRMNQALQNSGVSHSFRLVHSMPVNYTSSSDGSSSLSPDLLALQEGNGVFADVHTARETYKADLVSMLVDTGQAYGYTGVGYTLSAWEGRPDNGFTVCAIQSVDISHTLTHEVGHNLGAHHSKDQKQSPGPNTNLDNQYSAGWYFTGTDTTDYHTIMAYDDDGYGNSYTEAPLFSTPLVTYQGTSAGDDEHGDNTRLLNLTIGTIADYRVSNITLTGLTITGPASVNENSTASYTATASWSDGSTSTVDPIWSENSVYTTIDSGGLLTASSVTSNQTVTVSASYTSGSVTKNDTHTVTVVDSGTTLTGLTINGPTIVNENSTASYTATANWDDGSTSTVTPTWSENSDFATISSNGILSTSSVNASKNISVSASYTADTVTETDSISVTIRIDSFPWPMFLQAISNSSP